MIKVEADASNIYTSTSLSQRAKVVQLANNYRSAELRQSAANEEQRLAAGLFSAISSQSSFIPQRREQPLIKGSPPTPISALQKPEEGGEKPTPAPSDEYPFLLIYNINGARDDVFNIYVGEPGSGANGLLLEGVADFTPEAYTAFIWLPTGYVLNRWLKSESGKAVTNYINPPVYYAGVFGTMKLVGITRNQPKEIFMQNIFTNNNGNVGQIIHGFIDNPDFGAAIFQGSSGSNLTELISWGT